MQVIVESDETIARLASRAGRRRGVNAMAEITGTMTVNGEPFEVGGPGVDEAAAMAAEPERDGLGEVEVAAADLAATQARRR